MTENTKKSETKIEGKMTDAKIKFSDEVRQEIFRQVEDAYKSDIAEMINSKKCWRCMGISFETMSKIAVAIGGVLSFSSGYFGSNELSFISGSVSVLSLSLLQFGTFGFKQGKKKATDLNILLSKLDLETIPVLENDPHSLINGSEKRVFDKGFYDKGNQEDEEIGTNHMNTLNKISETKILNNMNDLNNLNEIGDIFKKQRAKINNVIIENTENVDLEIGKI
jgi:hypothetical protein